MSGSYHNKKERLTQRSHSSLMSSYLRVLKKGEEEEEEADLPKPPHWLEEGEEGSTHFHRPVVGLESNPIDPVDRIRHILHNSHRSHRCYNSHCCHMRSFRFAKEPRHRRLVGAYSVAMEEQLRHLLSEKVVMIDNSFAVVVVAKEQLHQVVLMMLGHTNKSQVSSLLVVCEGILYLRDFIWPFTQFSHQVVIFMIQLLIPSPSSFDNFRVISLITIPSNMTMATTDTASKIG